MYSCIAVWPCVREVVEAILLLGQKLYRLLISKPHSWVLWGCGYNQKHHNLPVYIFVCVFFLTSLLEYNCFTVVCQFLLYNKVNQLYIYIYPHIPSLLCLPPTLPIPPLQVVTEHGADLLCYAAASHQLSILHLVAYICPCHSLNSSQLTLPPPLVLKSILYVCIFIPVLELFGYIAYSQYK